MDQSITSITVKDFQTPPDVAEYMCSLIPSTAKTILEPSVGSGNMLQFLTDKIILTPENFFTMDGDLTFDCVVMNPPFSHHSTFGLPEDLKLTGMKVGYYFLTECMKKTNNVIALMPWLTIADSDVRLRHFMDYGLKSITALPRKTFLYARIQTCILELENGYQGKTEFKSYEFEKLKK